MASSGFRPEIWSKFYVIPYEDMPRGGAKIRADDTEFP